MSKSVRKGFTLIELLVVISIISILSVVGFVSYQNVTSKAKDAKMRADIDAIKKAYETNYDPSANGGQGGYKQLQGSQFAGGQVPSQPNGSPYPYTVGPNASIAPYYRTDGYQVSATLSDGKIIYAVSTQGTLASQGTLGTCDPLGTLSNGLVGYWKMDEGSGITTVDSSGNGNDGILTNGPTWIQGKLDRAISFDGVDDYMNSNLDVSWNNTNSLSISFWIKPNNTSDTAGILGKIYPDWEWAFYQSGAAVSLVYWNESGGHTNGMDNGWGNVLQAGQWTHLEYTWDGTASRFYADGVLKSTRTATNPTINKNRANNMMVGGHIYVWDDRYFNGLVDDVRIYNRALDPAEVSALANGCISP